MSIAPEIQLHNQHVYKFFRWNGWCASMCSRHMRAFFMYDFARQEIENQPIPEKY